jgi:UDP-glucose 4-epimerase
MHFAALSQVGESVEKPDLYWNNNVLGSLNLINSAINNNCKNFIFSSTCAVYGNQDNIVLDEDSYQSPMNAYGSSKRAIENMLADFKIAHDFDYVIFRYFNVAGADPEAEIGEFHRPETHLIPLILDTIDDKKDRLTIYGTDYNTPDGTCIRDYVHVCDIVDAHILGLNWLLNNKGSQIFNLGTGHGYSVYEVIDQIKKTTKKDVLIKEGPRRTGDCSKLVSGSIRALTELGWSTKRSDLRTMISDAWRWHRIGFYEE